jgi:uridine kinase
MTTEQLTALLRADASALLEWDRTRYFDQISKAADVIAANAEQRPIVLLAGPSGSGKTTTALLIERELERRGLGTHTLQMDHYFSPLTPEEIALMKENKLDLEKPSRVDGPFFRQQLGQLLKGEPVELPRYDFKTSKRVFEGHILQRKPGEIVIMEGIHALNPEVSGYTDSTIRVYVSVRTRVATQDGQVLHPSKIRLARRILRDRTGRGRNIYDTVGMKTKVVEGEAKYIMPYKPNAHIDIDTFYGSELGVYRPLLLEDLKKVLGQYPELEDLAHTMEELPDIDSAMVPKDSLLREFIGDSELAY